MKCIINSNRNYSTVLCRFYLIIFCFVESLERITKCRISIHIDASKEISMRAVTLNETRRLASRDIRRQKRRTSPTSIIMCATFEEEKDKKKETSFCVQSLSRRVLFRRILPTYPLNKEPLQEKRVPLAISSTLWLSLSPFLSLSLSFHVFFSRRWFSRERLHFYESDMYTLLAHMRSVIASRHLLWVTTAIVAY